jgi:hypothetical protein
MTEQTLEKFRESLDKGAFSEIPVGLGRRSNPVPAVPWCSEKTVREVPPSIGGFDPPYGVLASLRLGQGVQ